MNAAYLIQFVLAKIDGLEHDMTAWSQETRICFHTRVICVHYSEDGLQSGAMPVKSLQQCLLNVLRKQETDHLVDSKHSTNPLTSCVYACK